MENYFWSYIAMTLLWAFVCFLIFAVSAYGAETTLYAENNKVFSAEARTAWRYMLLAPLWPILFWIIVGRSFKAVMRMRKKLDDGNSQSLDSWVRNGQDLTEALRRAQAGEDLDALYTEYYANIFRQKPTDDGNPKSSQ